MCRVIVGMQNRNLEARSGIEPLFAALQADRHQYNQILAGILPHFDTRPNHLR